MHKSSDTPYVKDVVFRYYQTNVKPMIERGLFENAYYSMHAANALMDPEFHPSPFLFIAKLHYGAMFIGSAKKLEEDLKTGDSQTINETQRTFEASAAQTRLPRIM